jgi:hypothetical protein
LWLLTPDLDILGQQRAHRDGVQVEQEPVETGYPHAAAGLLRQFPIRGREAG